MLYVLIIEIFIKVLDLLTSRLPSVSVLPTILGVDTDLVLINANSAMHSLFNTLWPLADVFGAFIVIMVYYGIKMTARALLGHRAPGGIH